MPIQTLFISDTDMRRPGSLMLPGSFYPPEITLRIPRNQKSFSTPVNDETAAPAHEGFHRFIRAGERAAIQPVMTDAVLHDEIPARFDERRIPLQEAQRVLEGMRTVLNHQDVIIGLDQASHAIK